MKLKGREFRKWQVSSFPYFVFFRMVDDETIVLEALYHNKMDISTRLRSEIK